MERMQMLSSQIIIPKNLICSITEQIFKEPVFTSDGHTYEKEAIEEWLLTNDTSPKTGSILANKNLIPNWGKIGDVDDYLIQHPEAHEEVYSPKSLITQCLVLIKNKDTKTLKQLLDKDKRLLTADFTDNKKLLKIVCEQGTPEVILLVIEKLKNNDSLILSAEMHKSLLLKYYTMQAESIKTLINVFNWSPQQTDEFLKTQIEEDCADLVKAFIEADIVSVNKELDQKGNTALHIAAMKNCSNVAKALIESGANCKLENKDGNRPEKIAALNGFTKLSNNILHWRQDKKFEPLREEMRKQKIESEQQILVLRQQNQELQEKIEKLKGKVKTQKYNIEKFSIFNANHCVALKNLAEKDLYEKEKQLIEAREYSQGEKLEKQNKLIQTLLNGNFQLIETLEKQGASFVFPDKKGLYPLVAAVYGANLEAIRYVESKLQEKEISKQWAEVDVEKAKKNIDKVMPKNLSGATYEALGTWYRTNANKPWCKAYDVTCLQKEGWLSWNEEIWEHRGIGPQWDGWRTMVWTVRSHQGHAEITTRCMHTPSRTVHDSVVKTICDQLEELKNDVETKTKQSQSKIWFGAGFKK